MQSNVLEKLFRTYTLPLVYMVRLRKAEGACLQPHGSLKRWGRIRITEVPKLADLTYGHTLVIGCVGKFGYLFDLLRHYLLIYHSIGVDLST